MPKELSDFLQTELGNALIGLAIGTILGGLVKAAFDEWSARNKARRDLIASVTKSIERLANNYYWLLANNAGTLATLLGAYVQRREQLHLRQNSPRDSRQALDQLVRDYARESLPYYAHFTKLTYDFDWHAGNTFFLRHYWAGRSIRNLQNEIRDAFTGVADSDIIREMSATGKDGEPRSLTPSDLAQRFPEDGEIYQSYVRFFREEERVRRALKSLSAYTELFHHELSILYQDWFKEGWRGTVQSRPAPRRMPKELTPDTQQTILDVADQTRRGPYAIVPIGMSQGALAGKSAPTPIIQDQPPATPPQQPTAKVKKDQQIKPQKPPETLPEKDGQPLQNPVEPAKGVMP